jgi:hypothetical protein
MPPADEACITPFAFARVLNGAERHLPVLATRPPFRVEWRENPDRLPPSPSTNNVRRSGRNLRTFGCSRLPWFLRCGGRLRQPCLMDTASDSTAATGRCPNGNRTQPCAPSSVGGSAIELSATDAHRAKPTVDKTRLRLIWVPRCSILNSGSEIGTHGNRRCRLSADEIVENVVFSYAREI